MIVILCGSDRLTIDEQVRRLQQEHDPTQINSSRIEQAADHIDDVVAAAGATGFFGTTRFVVAVDLLNAAPRQRRRGAAAADHDRAVALLRAIPDTTCLVVVERDLDRATERQLRSVVPGIEITRCNVPRGRELVRWTQDRAAHYTSEIGPEAATALLEACFPGTWRGSGSADDVPPDLFRLDAEIAKLATAAGVGGHITVEDIGELVPDADALHVWALTDAVARRDGQAAVRELEHALGTGTAPEAIIGQLVSQLEAMAALAAAPRSDLVTAADATGISEGRLRQSARYAAAFPRDHVAFGLTLLRDLDHRAKTGQAEAADGLVDVVLHIAAPTGL